MFPTTAAPWLFPGSSTKVNRLISRKAVWIDARWSFRCDTMFGLIYMLWFIWVVRVCFRVPTPISCRAKQREYKQYGRCRDRYGNSVARDFTEAAGRVVLRSDGKTTD